MFRRVVFWVCVVVTVVFGVRFGFEVVGAFRVDGLNEGFRKQAGFAMDNKLSRGGVVTGPDLDGLRKGFPDAVFWLSVPGAGVDEPVFNRGGDELFYLSHLPDGSRARQGSLFTVRSRGRVRDSFLTYVLGHNAFGGQRFGNLGRLFDEGSDGRFFVFEDGRRLGFERVFAFNVDPVTRLYPLDGEFLSSAAQLREALVSEGLDEGLVGEQVGDGFRYVLLVTCNEFWDASSRKVVLGRLVEDVPYRVPEG